MHKGCSIMAIAADLPAIRKITQFMGHKADLGCTKCKFKAEREPKTVGATGKMSYFTSSPSEERCHEEVAIGKRMITEMQLVKLMLPVLHRRGTLSLYGCHTLTL